MQHITNAGTLRLVLTERELARAELANTLAFCQADFLPDKLTDLQRQMHAHDLSENLLVEWRRWFLRAEYADCHCVNCDSELTLDQAELNSGHFTCPDCRTEQPIPYAYLEPRSDFENLQRLNERILTEFDDALIDWQTLPDSLSDQELLSVLSEAGPGLNPATSDRIICRLALRGVTVDQLITSFDQARESKPLYQPFNHMDFLGGNKPVYLGVQQDEITEPDPTEPQPVPEPSESDSTSESTPARVFHRNREKLNADRGDSRDLAGGVIRAMLAISSLTAIAAWLLLPPLDSNVRVFLDQLLDGWSIDKLSLLSQTGFAAKILAVVSLVSAHALFKWLGSLHNTVEREPAPATLLSLSRHRILLVIPLLFYPLYYRLASVIREKVMENSLGLGSFDLASNQNSSRFTATIRTLAANPSLLILFAYWNLFVWWKCTYSDGAIQPIWWGLLPLQVLIQILCAGYVRAIMRLRRPPIA